MHFHYKRIHIGLRTIKTAAAVIIAMWIVSIYGATDSKMFFAMLGAMAVMEHSFKESLESCLTQIVGMFFGVLVGYLLLMLPFPVALDAGIGIVLVIMVYNMFRVRYSPTLSCLIVATLCMTPDLNPILYAIGRLWDTAVGMLVGMMINTLVFPYDSSNRIRYIAACLEKELIHCLEDMFDGDDILPDTEKMTSMVNDMAQMTRIYSSQSMLLKKRRNREKLEQFQVFVGKFRQLLAQLEVLHRMEHLGRLDEINRRHLRVCGAQIQDKRVLENVEEIDIVTNYHVKQILILRKELIESLKKAAV